MGYNKLNEVMDNIRSIAPEREERKSVMEGAGVTVGSHEKKGIERAEARLRWSFLMAFQTTWEECVLIMLVKKTRNSLG
jgi:hypothetical protein